MGSQKRSLNTYQKINTIFKRDEKGVIILDGTFVSPEFEYLRNNKWRCECKIDGTNMRIEVRHEFKYSYDPCDDYTVVDGAEFHVDYKGKTDNAQIPKELDKYMKEKFPEDVVLNALGLKKYIDVNEWSEHKWEKEEDIPNLYTIYGEGFGRKIQNGGGRYIKDGVGFIVFDVKVGEWWLNTEARDEIAEKLGAPVVPFMGYMTIDEAIDFVHKGFKTGLWDDKDLIEEGLVLRTDCGLRDRKGERLMTKIKYADFTKYDAVHK